MRKEPTKPTKRMNKSQVAKFYGHVRTWTARAVVKGILPPPIGGRLGYWTAEYLTEWEQRMAEQNIDLALAKMRQGN